MRIPRRHKGRSARAAHPSLVELERARRAAAARSRNPELFRQP